MTTKGVKQTKTKITRVSVPKKPKNKFLIPLFYIGGYFKGSWKELHQVRWPNRKATWGMTAAVIFFTTFFVVLIISLDWIFNQLFKLIIK